jgi:hypothetical protein
MLLIFSDELVTYSYVPTISDPFLTNSALELDKKPKSVLSIQMPFQVLKVSLVLLEKK